MRLKSVLAAAGCTVGILAVGVGPAAAGEVTGSGKRTKAPAHANSFCAYSGLNDDQAEEPGRVQSYGQIVKAGGKAFVPSPGEACRGGVVPAPPA